jgi:hypothetical protein
MQNRRLSLAQESIFQRALALKEETPIASEILKRYQSGEIATFEEVDNAIRALTGEDGAVYFWDRFFPQCGKTIAEALAPYLDPVPFSQGPEALEACAFLALGCEGNPHIHRCPLSACQAIEKEIGSWWHAYLVERLDGLFSALINDRIKESGKIFLLEHPSAYRVHVPAVIIPDFIQDHLRQNYAMTLTVAAVACARQNDDVWKDTEHALKLFKYGNPIIGFQLGGQQRSMFILTGDPCAESRRTNPPRNRRGFSDPPMADVPIPPPPPSSATNHAIPLPLH